MRDPGWLLSGGGPDFKSDKGHGNFKIPNRAKDLCSTSRRINWSILKYVPIDATKKAGKKTSPVVDFIVSMALRLPLLSDLMESVYPDNVSAHGVDGMVFQHMVPGSFQPLAGRFFLFKGFTYSIRQFLDILRIKQQPCFFMINNIRYSPAFGAHHRAFSSHGFEKGLGNPFEWNAVHIF